MKYGQMNKALVSGLIILGAFILSANAGDLTIKGDLNVTSNLTVEGTVNVRTNRITNVAAPESPSDAATKAYVDENAMVDTNVVTRNGTQGMLADLNFGGKKGTNASEFVATLFSTLSSGDGFIHKNNLGGHRLETHLNGGCGELYLYDASGNLAINLSPYSDKIWTKGNIEVEKAIKMKGTTAPNMEGGYGKMWAEDISGTKEVRVMDDSGNVTTISPHNFTKVELDPADPYPLVFRHHNPYVGKEQWIYLSKLARAVEKLTGEKIIYEQDIPKRDWAADEKARFNEREAERQEWQRLKGAHDAWLALPEKQRTRISEPPKSLGGKPESYVIRDEPKWIIDRKNK